MTKIQTSSFLILGFSVIILSLIFGSVHAVDEANEKLIESAFSLLKEEKFEQAIPILEKILKSDPNNLLVLKNLAVAYTDTEMYDKAIIQFDKILELKPNSPEILYGKAVSFNSLGQPEKALLTLDKLDKKYSNDKNILVTIAYANVLLGEFENAQKNYKKVLDKNPNSKSANLNMLLLSYHMKDHDMAKKYLVKLLGPDPKRLSSTCAASGCMGKIPFLFPIEDSSAYQITVQIQVRNASDELIAIIESDRIKYTPHPIMDKILSNYDVVNTIQNEQGIFEETRIVEKSEPKINPYFMDRVELFYNDYNVLFAYNMAIPLESEDYIITEWIIQKKI